MCVTFVFICSDSLVVFSGRFCNMLCVIFFCIHIFDFIFSISSFLFVCSNFVLPCSDSLVVLSSTFCLFSALGMAHRQYYLTFFQFLFQTLYFIFSFLYFYALLWGWHSGTRVGATAVRGLIGQILRTNGKQILN